MTLGKTTFYDDYESGTKSWSCNIQVTSSPFGNGMYGVSLYKVDEVVSSLCYAFDRNSKSSIAILRDQPFNYFPPFLLLSFPEPVYVQSVNISYEARGVPKDSSITGMRFEKKFNFTKSPTVVRFDYHYYPLQYLKHRQVYRHHDSGKDS